MLGIHDIAQLKSFSLDGTGQQYVFGEEPMDEMVDAAIELRLKIESMPSNTVEDINVQAGLMAECEQRVEFLKCAADMLVAAELKGGTSRERLGNRDHAAVQIGHYLEKRNPDALRAAAAKELGRRSFHWPLEFPEIHIKRGGFDGFIGNPPFVGGRRIRSTFGGAFLEYLTTVLFKGSSGNADLCAFFFRRAHQLLRSGGVFGLVATNTIAQGDTRSSGLEELTASGSSIFRAVPSRPWPGVANLEVAHVWLRKGKWVGPCSIDEMPATGISASLTQPNSENKPPNRLKSNDSTSFQGSIVLGMGFVLQPEEANQLIEKNSRNRDVLFPFLNGEDLNSRPDQSPSRWVINFFDWPIERAMEYPDCFQILENRVKPERTRKKPGTDEYALRKPLPQRWWIYADKRPELYVTISKLRRCLVGVLHTKYWSVNFYKDRIVFSHALAVFALEDDASFGLLTSSIHEAWAREYSGSLETRLRYTPSDCYGTFPFYKSKATLVGSLAKEYDAQRQRIMTSEQKGLTEMYNRFHNSEVAGNDIQELRDLHVEMDKAVTVAYGWDDLKLGHEFHQTKQGLRFTISESSRREVLSRLLKLNHERHAEEVDEGLHVPKRAGRKGGTVEAGVSAPQEGSLFDLLSYPAAESDKAICSALLAAIFQSNGLSSIDSLTVLLLATHPAWCEAFLKPAERKKLTAVVKKTSKHLIVAEGVSIRWKDARDYLERRQAVTVDRSSNDQRINATSSLESVKATFPYPVDAMVKLALTALVAVKVIEQDASKALPEHQRILSIFREQAIAMELAA